MTRHREPDDKHPAEPLEALVEDRLSAQPAQPVLSTAACVAQLRDADARREQALDSCLREWSREPRPGFAQAVVEACRASAERPVIAFPRWAYAAAAALVFGIGLGLAYWGVAPSEQAHPAPLAAVAPGVEPTAPEAVVPVDATSALSAVALAERLGNDSAWLLEAPLLLALAWEGAPVSNP